MNVVRELNSSRDDLVRTPDFLKCSVFFLKQDSKVMGGLGGIALRGLVDFVERWEFVDLEFDVRELGVVGVVGS